jgi:energy-coupling factor transport system ATP-binding protein
MDDLIMIDAHDIRFSYDGPGGRRSLNGAQLHVAPGEFVAVLGHNGCGKSTLVKHFNALLPLQHGTLTVDGMDAADPANRWALRRKVGMVFQNPDNQFVSTIVGEDVAFGLENYGVPEAEIPARVAAALAAVDMVGYENRATHTLSGGQKQRVALAGVLALSPDILVFDEATAMLDPDGRQEVLRTIHRLHAQQHKTVVMITHYIEEAIGADRVYLIHNGKMIAGGTAREMLTQPELLAAAGLTPPMPVQMYHDLKQAGITLARCPLTLEELAEELCRSQ